MTFWPKLSAGLKIAAVIAVFWTISIVALRFGIFLFQDLSWANLSSWVLRSVLPLLGTGMLLGTIYAAGLGLFRSPGDQNGLSRTRSIAIGTIGGLAAYLGIGLMWAGISGVWIFSILVAPLLTSLVIGAATGYGVWRVATRPALPLSGGAARSISP